MLQDNLKRLREQKGLSQAEVAEQLHVVRQTVSKWEKGRSAPDADMLVNLAAVLEVSASDLIGEEVRTADNLEELALQAALVNEQLSLQNRRIDSITNGAKRIGIGVLALLLLFAVIVPFARQCTMAQQGELINPYFTSVKFVLNDEVRYCQIDALPDDPNRVSEDPLIPENLASALGVLPEELPPSLDPAAYANDPDSMANYLNAFAEYVKLHGGRVIAYEYWDTRPNGYADEPYLVLPE